MLIANGKVINKRDDTVSSVLLEEKKLVSLPVGSLCLRNSFSLGLAVFFFLFIGTVFGRCLCEVDDDVDAD